MYSIKAPRPWATTQAITILGFTKHMLEWAQNAMDSASY